METYISIYITFEGLGFCCFNPERQGAEIAFLQIPSHDLKITVTGTDGRREIFENIADDAKIWLLSEGSPIKDFRLNNKGAFQRRSVIDDDTNLLDLRWLVDFEGKEFHDEKAKPRKSKGSQQQQQQQQQNTDGQIGLTRMFLPHAYFFTEQILLTEYELEQIDNTTSARTPKFSGLFGGALGAKVDAVKASLLIDGKPPFHFNEEDDPKMVTRFFVTITNICEPCADRNPPPQSDFYKYYDVLQFEDDFKYDFKLPKKSAMHPRPAMCEFAWLSKTESLDEYFPDTTTVKG